MKLKLSKPHQVKIGNGKWRHFSYGPHYDGYSPRFLILTNLISWAYGAAAVWFFFGGRL